MAVRARSSLLLLLVAVAAGCGQRGGGGARPAGGGDEAAAAEAGTVVAEVDGVPITAERVARLAAETGESPREVVERLIDFELLAAEARRRGLTRGADLRETTRKAMVQRYLEVDFERPRTAAAIPDAWLRKAYDRNKGQFVHPKFYKVDHVRVVRSRDASAADQARELALGEKIYREAVKTTTPEEFLELAKRFDGVDGQRVVAEKISTPVHARANLAKEFVAAAMALQRRGEVSRPVQTKFGTHVIYLVDIREAVDRSFAEVRDEVRAREHPFWLQAEFAAMIERLRRETPVTGFEGDLRRGGEAR
jgi:hypothetical protein